MIHSIGSLSPVRIDPVASTIPSSAGMKIGNRISGSSSSRFRLRIESAAKNVPFATSAHVPSGSTSASSQACPATCRL